MVWVNDWSLVHELLEVVVQKLKHKVELSIAVQYLHQAVRDTQGGHEGYSLLTDTRRIAPHEMVHVKTMCLSYLTMLGWSSSCSREISRIAVDGTPSHSLQGGEGRREEGRKGRNGEVKKGREK